MRSRRPRPAHAARAAALCLGSLLLGVALGAGEAPPPLPGSLPLVSVGATNAAGPRIQFAEPVHNFGEVKGGEEVQFTYVFTNVGADTLQVNEVRPSCGCTTAGDWTRRVTPGATGTIPIRLRTVGFSGPVTKTITVTCNDPHQSNIVLKLTGTLWQPVDVIPTAASFTYDPAEPLVEAKEIRIQSHLKDPLVLSELVFTNRAFRIEVTTNKPGQEYTLRISTVPPLGPGTVSSTLTLKTTSAEQPQILVPVYAIERPAVMVSPRQLLVPDTTLPAPRNMSVIIQTFGTNVLELSEAQTDAPGATLQLRELQKGRSFSLMVSFPAGYKPDASHPAQLTVKSNHPRYPMLKIPILAMQRPAVLPIPTRPAPPRPTVPAAPPPLPPRAAAPTR